RRPHLRKRAEQKAFVARRGAGPRLARQGAAVVGTRLSFPRSARLPVRQRGMQTAAGATGGRRLRRGARLLVHRCRAPPEAGAAGEAQAGAEDGRSAGRLPPGPSGAVAVGAVGRRSPAGSSPIRPGHVEVAVFVAKNNPKTRVWSRRRFPASIGCIKSDRYGPVRLTFFSS